MGMSFVLEISQFWVYLVVVVREESSQSVDERHVLDPP